MNATRLILTLTFGVLGLGALAACQAPANLSGVEATLEGVAKKQDKILARLDEVEKAAKSRPTPAKAARPRPDSKTVHKVDLGEAQWKGAKDAKVTIVEWSDFQCPFCSRVNPTVTQILKEYSGDVKIAFKHNPLPFHKRAMPAAMAAEAAGRQGKFWEMHDKLFANGRNLTDENFRGWAKELGLNVGQFEKDLQDPALKRKVEQQQAQGNKLGARGTPAFFINGRFLSGAQPFPAFKTIIDEEMKKADKLLADGVGRGELYAKMVLRK